MKKIDIISLARLNVMQLKPYSSARDDFEGSASVFLDANENPFPTGHNRYPDPRQRALKTEIAKEKKVRAEQIFLGNGSDEAIDLLFRVFCEPGQADVIIPQPSYGMYSVSASINDVVVTAPILTKSFDIESNEVLKWVTPRTKLIFLCSPNNPSGNLLNDKEIEIILDSFNGIVVLDEAYIDFTESPSWAMKLDQFPNLVILQTFSKAWGLAGLRLGMCFAHEEIIGLLNKIKPPYNINGYTQAAVLHSLQHKKEEKNRAVAEIKAERETLRSNLQGVTNVKKVYPSDANFLLVEFDDAKNVYSKLVQHGIIVRDRSNVTLCDNCLRITVGTKNENNQLIEALRQL